VSKGSKQRPTSKEAFDKNYEIIFNKKAMDQLKVDLENSEKNYKIIQQDQTELNGDGNRERGRYGEDESVDE
tara:strand:+ start:97 stop:312 length:216 start_codon:yes stop_codon:yes gene_type:complete